MVVMAIGVCLISSTTFGIAYDWTIGADLTSLKLGGLITLFIAF